jgi:predicted HAD superfamily Cof-like phosphohydrolase
MLKNQTNITEFMQMAGQNVPTSLTASNEATRKLRIKLILEELIELAEASGFTISVEKDHVSGINTIIQKDLSNVYIESNGKEPDLIEMADAIGDLDYVNTGAAIAYGMDLEVLHDEIHASNMSKLWTEDECKYTDLFAGKKLVSINDSDKNNIEFVLDSGEKYIRKLLKPESDRKYGVFLNGKLKKSPSYNEANIGKVLNFI